MMLSRYALFAAGLFAVGGLLPTPAAAQLKTIHSERSLYRNIFVTEDGDLRCMTFRRATEGTRQTCFEKSKPENLYFPYARMMMGSLYLNPDPQRILIVGLGGGTLPMAIRRLLPDSTIDVVEIDAAVTKAARQFFNFKEDDKLKVSEEDGRVFVKRAIAAGTRYDLIMLDAFEDDYIPEHLLTKEFLLEVKSILTPNGVVAANTFSSSGLYPYESATYENTFGKFYNLKSSNRVIWAQNGELTSNETLNANAKLLEPKLEAIGVRSGFLFTMMNASKDWDANTRILTDQYAPSNLLNSRGRSRR
jgi:spermidine synthase